MTLIEILSIILIHWIADFVLQTHWQATNKSKSNYALTLHVFTYTAVWFAAAIAYSFWFGGMWIIVLFPLITFVCHWITDYFTSRLNSKLWAEGDVHNFIRREELIEKLMNKVN